MKEWYSPKFRVLGWFDPTLTPPGWFSKDFGPSLDATVTASAEASADAVAGLVLNATVTASAEAYAAGVGVVPLPPIPPVEVGGSWAWGSPKHKAPYRRQITPWIPKDRRKEQEAVLRAKAAKVWEAQARSEEDFGVAISAMMALMAMDD